MPNSRRLKMASKANQPFELTHPAQRTWPESDESRHSSIELPFMKTANRSRPPASVRPKPALALGLRIADGLLVLCLAVEFFLLLRPTVSSHCSGSPAGPSATASSPGRSRFPKDQWRADARTLAAALRYLLEPEPDSQLTSRTPEVSGSETLRRPVMPGAGKA